MAEMSNKQGRSNDLSAVACPCQDGVGESPCSVRLTPFTHSGSVS